MSPVSPVRGILCAKEKVLSSLVLQSWQRIREHRWEGITGEVDGRSSVGPSNFDFSNY